MQLERTELAALCGPQRNGGKKIMIAAAFGFAVIAIGMLLIVISMRRCISLHRNSREDSHTKTTFPEISAAKEDRFDGDFDDEYWGGNEG